MVNQERVFGLLSFFCWGDRQLLEHVLLLIGCVGIGWAFLKTVAMGKGRELMGFVALVC